MLRHHKYDPYCLLAVEEHFITGIDSPGDPIYMHEHFYCCAFEEKEKGPFGIRQYERGWAVVEQATLVAISSVGWNREAAREIAGLLNQCYWRGRNEEAQICKKQKGLGEQRKPFHARQAHGGQWMLIGSFGDDGVIVSDCLSRDVAEQLADWLNKHWLEHEDSEST
jgi:hypothetical protein